VKFHAKHFRVRPGEKVDLGERKTRVKPLYNSKQHYETLLEASTRELSREQSMLYASDQYALLVIFQAMDAAGKDSVIKHVMSGVNRKGCQVFSFKHPSAQDPNSRFSLAHERCACRARPHRHFQPLVLREVLVVRVHPEISRLSACRARPAIATNCGRGRYRSIVDLERHLTANGTRIVKFFLHLSKRSSASGSWSVSTNPDKNWKFSPADVTERRFWKKYMKAYAGLPRCDEHARGALVRRAGG